MNQIKTTSRKLGQRHWMLFLLASLLLTFASCGMQTASTDGVGDTIALKYSQYLTLVKHDGYMEAVIANPWKEGSVLHRYLLVPKGKEGDEKTAELKKQNGASSVGGAQGQGTRTDIVRTPITSSVVYTSPHIQLMYELGCEKALTGVCDLAYINITDVKRRAALVKDKQSKGMPKNGGIVDCGSSMQPTIECIIALRPEALLISPFENSGGYGKLDKLGIPIIETADYMETSPLGRAEWIRFYGMLFGSKEGLSEESQNTKSDEVLEEKDEEEIGRNSKADSLFLAIEKEYLALKDSAARLPLGRSILTERKMGGVWYVPGGKSTTGILLQDAHAKYVFASDKHSGSLPLSPEQILAKASEIDVWAFKYFGNPGAPSLGENVADHLMSKADLLQEYSGYSQLKAFQTGEIYECNTNRVPFFEYTSFHPERLLREYILLAHPRPGHLTFFTKLKR